MAALAPLDTTALARTAANDPTAAARTWLDSENARTTAALAGRPTGQTDAALLAFPRKSAITAARDAAVAAAIEATGAADGHRREHGVTARLFDTAVRRRQAALDAEAGRLGRVASRLDGAHDRDRARIVTATTKEARANRVAEQDWTWSAPVRAATARAAALDRVRRAVDAGEADVIAAAASGDTEGAISATAARDARLQRERAEALVASKAPETRAVGVAVAAEHKSGSDPVRLAAARVTTAAAIAGDVDVRQALESGRLAEAARCAADWKRRRDQEHADARRQVLAEEHRDHTATIAPGPR